MGDVTHATASGLAVVRTRSAYPDYEPFVRACDGSLMVGLDYSEFFSQADARFILGLDDWKPRDSDFVPWPTCPRCCRLLDEALDPTFEQDRRTDAAWADMHRALREETT